VPFYAALVARTRLAKIQERLVSALQVGGRARLLRLPLLPVARSWRTLPPPPHPTPPHTPHTHHHPLPTARPQDLDDPANNQGWPTARVLLQLKLFTTLFPVSDKRHAVLTPVALLLGRWASAPPPP
jgi:hypothetical protein